MIVERLELVDFRNYTEAAVSLLPGTNAVLGSNGQGKTNLVEALAYLATLSSFRGAPTEALVRVGATTAVLRAQVRDDDARATLIEAELAVAGRSRVLVNRQRLGRTRDLLGTIRVTVFSPDDLNLVKGGPTERRRFLDDALVAVAIKFDPIRREVDRVLKQRNRLLKQAGGRADAEIETTLDVWDAKFVSATEALVSGRESMIERCAPMVDQAYADLAGTVNTVSLRYVAPWREVGLAEALRAARVEDLRRGVSTVGPHRDDLELIVNDLPARTHGSQGEQRTLALALRLGVHRLITERTGSAPVLVLDDVLSELDPDRADALLRNVPAGQVVITSASPLPPAAKPAQILRIVNGALVDQRASDADGADGESEMMSS